MRRTLLMLSLLLVPLSSCSKSGGGPTSPGPGGGTTNHNPTLNVTMNPAHMAYGDTAAVSVTTSDPDGDQVTLSYSASGGSIHASGPTATAPRPSAPAGAR